MSLGPKGARCVWLVLLAVVAWFCSPALSAPDELEKLGAVYDYKRWQCRVSGNDFKLTISNKVTIYNSRGDKYAHLSIYEDDFVKLKDVTVITRDSTGKQLHELSKKDMTKHCGYGSNSLYSDQCVYVLGAAVPGYPYSFEYEYTRNSSSLFFLRGCDFQHLIPIIRASYELSAPRGVDIAYKFYGWDNPPEIIEDEKQVTYLWQADSIPALDDIDYVPHGYNEPAELLLVAQQFELANISLTTESWTGIGQWYQLLAQGRYQLSDEEPLLSGEDELTRVRGIYDDIINNTRYVLVDEGIEGSWQPHPAELVAQYGYGDCKDLSTFLIARLRNSGIAAWPCLISTHAGIRDTTFPNFKFNHIITMVELEGDTLWLDPTCNRCPLGETSYSIENVDALVASQSGGVVRRTPRSESGDNATVRTTDIRLHSDKSVTFSTAMNITGHFARYIRGALRGVDSEETRKIVENRFDGANKLYRIDSFEITNADSIYLPLIISVEASFIKPVREIGSAMYCSPFFLNKPNAIEKVELDDRIFPISLYYPRRTRDEISITLDPDLVFDSLVIPESDSLTADFGKISVEASANDNIIRISLLKEYTDYMVPVDQFETYGEFCNRLKKITNSYVKLVR